MIRYTASRPNIETQIVAPIVHRRPRAMSTAFTTREEVFAYLEEFANAGHRCPSNQEMADHFGWASMGAGTTWLQKLRDAGLVKVHNVGPRHRIVEIVATGKRTA